MHPGGLGDIILSLPAIRLLRKSRPAARITIAANLDYLPPLREGVADAAISLSQVPLHGLYAPVSSFEPDRIFWGAYDQIVSWTGSGHSDFERNLRTVHPGAILSPWRPDPGDERHVSQLFIDSLGLTPETPRDIRPEIRVNPEASRTGVRWLQSRGWRQGDRLIAIHPGAGSESKRWPLERFRELARRLALHGDTLLLISGPAEANLRISEAFPETRTIAAESIPLDWLAAVLVRCRAYVGNDSGISHLAAGLQVPSVVLFGPTLPRHWAPLGKRVVVLHRPGGCKACVDGCGDHTCLLNISVEDVQRILIGKGDFPPE